MKTKNLFCYEFCGIRLVLLMFFILFFQTQSVEAQPSMPKEKADSLWSVWEDESLADTSRLNAIHRYAWGGYLFTKPDSAFYYAGLEYNFAKNKGLKKQMASATNTQGVSFAIRGNYTKAINYLTQSLKIEEELGNKRGISNLLGNIGNICESQGDYTKAVDYLTQSLKIKEEIGNKQGISNSLINIGVVYDNLGDYAKALDSYNQSLKINEEIGDKQGIANSLGNIGIIYKNKGDYTKALDYFTKCLKLKEELGDQQGIAYVLGNIGIIYKNKGDYIKAIDYFTQSLKIQEEIGDKNGIANSLNNIGVIYKFQGDYTKAIEYYTRSLNIREEIGDQKGIATSLNNIGNTYTDQGDYTKALKNSKKSYKISSTIGADLRVNNAVRTLYQNYLFTDSLYNARKHLSILFERRNQNLQTNFFTLPENEKQSYFSTMEADYGLYHDFALNFQDQFDNVTDTSYNIALQNKGITLKSSTAMRQSIQNSGDTTLINNYENWLSLKKKIANTNETDSTYKELVNQANDMERQLVKKSNVFSDFDKVKNLQWQDVQAGLKNNEAAIEFVHFKSEIDTANPVIYSALIVKKDSKHPKMVKLCTEKDLKDILGTFQGNNLDFVNSVYGNKDKAQKALYEKVWQPMEQHLEGVENIYLSPSGLLHKIAFSAIAKDQNAYLCDNYNIRQQNSTGKVALAEEVNIANSQNFLILGGVQYNTDTSANEVWSYLPGTLEETTNIKSYLKKKKFNITHLTAAEAGEEQFKTKAPEANILHIATHGFFFPDPEMVRAELKENQEYHEDLAFRGQNINPDQMQRSTRYADWTFVKNKNPLMRSGLALAHANDVWQRPTLAEGEDGVLTANEVSTLNLQNTDLVVLSACETGLGDIKGSEGVYGLQRAFKMAGAKYLIMSLWQVPDKETAEFMEMFYKNLIKLEDIPEAFNKTQKAMRKKYDPYYWAAFVLVE